MAQAGTRNALPGGEGPRRGPHRAWARAALVLVLGIAPFMVGCGSTPEPQGRGSSPAPQASVVASAPVPSASTSPAPSPALASPVGAPSPAASTGAAGPAAPEAASPRPGGKVPFSPVSRTSPVPASPAEVAPSPRPSAVSAAPPSSPRASATPSRDLPVYPYAQRKAATTTQEKSTTGEAYSHEILVLTTTDSIDRVRDFYKGRIKPNIVLDRKEQGRIVTMSLAPAGGTTESFVNTVVIQEEPGGSTQITLSSYKPAP